MELEMKFKIEKDYAPVLKLQGFKKSGEKHQVDIYFLSGEVIKGKKTWLRLREDKLKGCFSCDLHRLNSFISTEETEIALNSITDLNKMKKIISFFGFKVQCVINKKRAVYIKDNVEISLDVVENLGRFIEIEINGEENQENLLKLKETVRKLGLKEIKQIKSGYPNLLKNKMFHEQQRS